MRPQFTETVSSALRHADEEARRANQEFVGTEHLLLGVLACDRSQAVRALEAETDTQELVRNLRKQLPQAKEQSVVTGWLPLSPKAQRAINTAISQTQAAGEEKVSTPRLVLALLDDAESFVSRALSDSGADLHELAQMLSRPPEEPEP